MKLDRKDLMERAGLGGRLLSEEVRSPDGSKARKLQKLIDESINLVDDSLSYKDFADAVALQLEDTYGEHNYAMFLEQLRMQLRQ
tara:strand:+ start:4869 stop:5123 length:255 start_codon:yes stop_codon:yes gene_type:complete